MNEPKISFIIPTRNEENTISKCIDSLLNLDYPKDKIEILICEGKSKDDTRKIIENYAKKHSNIKIFDDLDGNKPKARNICVENSTGELLVNYSGHAIADKNLLNIIVKKFNQYKKNTDIIAIGFPNYTPKQNIIGESIGRLFQGFMAGGGTSIFTQNTKMEKEKIVKHVPFVCYKKEIFEKIGYFDKKFQYGQDTDFNIRLNNFGYKILYTSETNIYLYKPISIKKLFKKMYLYGIARTKLIKKHKKESKIHFLFPIALLSFPILILINHNFIFLLPIYFLTCIISSITICKSIIDIFLSMIVYPCIHIGYSLGILRGIINGI